MKLAAILLLFILAAFGFAAEHTIATEENPITEIVNVEIPTDGFNLFLAAILPSRRIGPFNPFSQFLLSRSLNYLSIPVFAWILGNAHSVGDDSSSGTILCILAFWASQMLGCLQKALFYRALNGVFAPIDNFFLISEVTYLSFPFTFYSFFPSIHGLATVLTLTLAILIPFDLSPLF